VITFSVFGRKHSGKTTMCQELVNVLSKKGTVGYEKRTHTTIKLDPAPANGTPNPVVSSA